jgi:hypothetical protein
MMRSTMYTVYYILCLPHLGQEHCPSMAANVDKGVDFFAIAAADDDDWTKSRHVKRHVVSWVRV